MVKILPYIQPCNFIHLFLFSALPVCRRIARRDACVFADPSEEKGRALVPKAKQARAS